MARRIIRIAALLFAVVTCTGCATYWRDRARDFQDIYSFKAGRMTGIRLQAGPAAVSAIGERLPAPLYCGRDVAREQRMKECADLWQVQIPADEDVPSGKESAVSMTLSIFPFRRHGWSVSSDASSKEVIRKITQYEVDHYHRARRMDDFFHIAWVAKDPAPSKAISSTTGLSRQCYDHKEVSVRLKSRPISDVGFELGLYCGVSARVNLMEFLDFALGFFALDILHDDIPSITPETARRSMYIHRSRFY